MNIVAGATTVLWTRRFGGRVESLKDRQRPKEFVFSLQIAALSPEFPVCLNVLKQIRLVFGAESPAEAG